MMSAQIFLRHRKHLGYLFCKMTNKCTIISQIITLLHVSTLTLHHKGAPNQYLANLHNYFKTQLLIIQFKTKIFQIGFMQVLTIFVDDTLVSKHVGM